MNHSPGQVTEEGIPLLFDGIGAVVRGDLFTVLYAADASTRRTRWLFERVERLADKHAAGIVALVIIPQTSKPPDQAAREAEAAAFRRMGSRIRRVVTVPEGHAFHVSIVRIVAGAYVALSGRSASHFVAKSLDHGIALVVQAKTCSTPGVAEMLADIAVLRAALASALPPQ